MKRINKIPPPASSPNKRRATNLAASVGVGAVPMKTKAFHRESDAADLKAKKKALAQDAIYALHHLNTAFRVVCNGSKFLGLPGDTLVEVEGCGTDPTKGPFPTADACVLPRTCTFLPSNPQGKVPLEVAREHLSVAPALTLTKYTSTLAFPVVVPEGLPASVSAMKDFLIQEHRVCKHGSVSRIVLSDACVTVGTMLITMSLASEDTVQVHSTTFIPQGPFGRSVAASGVDILLKDPLACMRVVSIQSKRTLSAMCVLDAASSSSTVNEFMLALALAYSSNSFHNIRPTLAALPRSCKTADVVLNVMRRMQATPTDMFSKQRLQIVACVLRYCLVPVNNAFKPFADYCNVLGLAFAPHPHVVL